MNLLYPIVFEYYNSVLMTNEHTHLLLFIEGRPRCTIGPRGYTNNLDNNLHKKRQLSKFAPVYNVLFMSCDARGHTFSVQY